MVDAELMAMTLSGTPGMVELLTAGDPTVFAKSIESLITEYVSFERNVPQKLMSAETAWSSMDGSMYADCEDLIVDDTNAYGNCTSWFGKEVCADYHHFVHLVSISPEGVKSAYADMISSPYSTETELTMMHKSSWEEYLTVFRKAWRTAQSSTSAAAQLNISSAPNQNWASHAKPELKQSQRPQQTSQQLQRTQRFTDQDSRTDFQDRSLQEL